MASPSCRRRCSDRDRLRIADLTIADVASASREDFLERTVRLSEIPARRRKEVETQARAMWDAARKVADAGRNK